MNIEVILINCLESLYPTVLILDYLDSKIINMATLNMDEFMGIFNSLDMCHEDIEDLSLLDIAKKFICSIRQPTVNKYIYIVEYFMFPNSLNFTKAFCVIVYKDKWEILEQFFITEYRDLTYIRTILHKIHNVNMSKRLHSLGCEITILDV